MKYWYLVIDGWGYVVNRLRDEQYAEELAETLHETTGGLYRVECIVG